MSQYCGTRRLREELSAFLSHVPGTVDRPASDGDLSSLRGLIDKPPIVKELIPLSGTALQGFRLNPGPIPESYAVFDMSGTSSEQPHKKHKKKHKRVLDPTDQTEDGDKKLRKRRDEDREKKKKKKDRKEKKKKRPSPPAT